MPSGLLAMVQPYYKLMNAAPFILMHRHTFTYMIYMPAGCVSGMCSVTNRANFWGGEGGTKKGKNQN